ncbi:MAG: T9SS type A sorting domain-containing protein [Ignavibacteriota bacterium]
MNKLNIFILLIAVLISTLVHSQSTYNKVGGVGFRIDDSQYYPQDNLMRLDSLFNQKGLKFTYAVNFGIYISQALLEYLNIMQIDGDQIADHSPDHQTRFFDVPLSDIPFYQGRSGVDHIVTVYNGNWAVQDSVARICLKFDHVRTDYQPDKEGLIYINGNTVTSITPNEFTLIDSLSSNLDRYSMNAIYIPSLNKLFKFDRNNVTSNTITNLKSFWDEDINLTLDSVQFHKMWLYDVFYTTDALRLMAERTQRMCDQHGITRPTAWIQPGGYFPQFYRADIKEALEPMGYFTAGVFANPAPPYYNSYDPNDDKRYGINWEDFNEEDQTLAQSKKLIADRFAKHYVSIGHSHLLGTSTNFYVEFPEYLLRTASILDWCNTKGIPIKTYTEWAELLYRTPQNPYVNVMPKLENDLDEDGKPDGFTIFSGSFLDKNDGPNTEFPYSVSRNNEGNFCQVAELGGIEKGENYFGIWIKGFQDNLTGIKIKLNYEGGSTSESWYFIYTNNTEWQKYDLTQAYNQNHSPLIIPENVNTIDVTIREVGISGVSKVAGFEMKKKSSNNIFPPWLQKSSFSNNSVQLIWVDNSDNETEFRVKRKFEGQTTYTTIKNNLPPNSTNWIDNLLDLPDSLRIIYNDSITIYYQIESLNVSDSSFSNVDSIRVKTVNILPVELSSFNAKFNIKQIDLDWETATEVNNYGFEVERKTETDWKKIGFVQGNGNSNSPKKYSFMDNNLLGSNKFYYRLKQVDNDGQFSYSNTIEVSLPPVAYELEQNYPNPFNPITKIRYQLPEKSRVFIKIFNSLGAEVKILLDEIKEPGNYEVDFDGTNLSSGVYFYRMQSENFISTKKMIILK